jgi:hypothetical protein
VKNICDCSDVCREFGFGPESRRFALCAGTSGLDETARRYFRWQFLCNSHSVRDYLRSLRLVVNIVCEHRELQIGLRPTRDDHYLQVGSLVLTPEITLTARLHCGKQHDTNWPHLSIDGMGVCRKLLPTFPPFRAVLDSGLPGPPGISRPFKRGLGRLLSITVEQIE